MKEAKSSPFLAPALAPKQIILKLLLKISNARLKVLKKMKFSAELAKQANQLSVKGKKKEKKKELVIYKLA